MFINISSRTCVLKSDVLIGTGSPVPWIGNITKNGNHPTVLMQQPYRKKRIAQNGNILAREEIMKLVRFIIDEWIESRPMLSSWAGHESMIEKRIETCIRCYRYSGTFIGYLLKTLEYAVRGLKHTYSIR